MPKGIYKRKERSPEHCKRISRANRGERNGNWKGGIWVKEQKIRLLARLKPKSCEVCGIPESELKEVLHYDHDHNTGQFRGWLCKGCNLALGFSRDKPWILRALADYLEKKR